MMCVFTTLQVSKLCPGEYPTTIDILITDSTDDTIIQNINDVMLMEGSQDNILTTVDNITLQSDMKYTIQVSFSNLDGEFNITINKTFSKFSLVMSYNYNYIEHVLYIVLGGIMIFLIWYRVEIYCGITVIPSVTLFFTLSIIQS